MYTMAWPMAHGERRANACGISQGYPPGGCVRPSRKIHMAPSQPQLDAARLLHLGTDAPAGELADQLCVHVTDTRKSNGRRTRSENAPNHAHAMQAAPARGDGASCSPGAERPTIVVPDGSRSSGVIRCRGGGATPPPSPPEVAASELTVAAEIQQLLRKTRKRKLEIVERDALELIDAVWLGSEQTSWEREDAPSPSSWKASTEPPGSELCEECDVSDPQLARDAQQQQQQPPRETRRTHVRDE